MNNPTKDPNDITTVIDKRFAINEWKGIGKISGIYKIVNKVNGKYYVGSSRNIVSRWNDHLRHLRRNTHQNDFLQKAWCKYGKNNFYFTLVKITTVEELLTEEQMFLTEAQLNGKSYNLIYTAGGGPQTGESANKISVALKKRYSITENYQKMCVINRKRYQDNPNLKTKIQSSVIDSYKKDPTLKDNLSRIARIRLDKQYDGLDSPKYTFYNLLSGETYYGTRYGFCHKFNLVSSHVYLSVKIPGRTVKEWVLLEGKDLVSVKVLKQIKTKFSNCK